MRGGGRCGLVSWVMCSRVVLGVDGASFAPRLSSWCIPLDGPQVSGRVYVSKGLIPPPPRPPFRLPTPPRLFLLVCVGVGYRLDSPPCWIVQCVIVLFSRFYGAAVSYFTCVFLFFFLFFFLSFLLSCFLSLFRFFVFTVLLTVFSFLGSSSLSPALGLVTKKKSCRE